MKYLCIVPPEYTVMALVYRDFPIEIYKVATRLKSLGHQVKLLNMFPMYKPRRNVRWEGNLFYKDLKVSRFFCNMKCGNYNKEKLTKEFHRLGFELDVLGKEIDEFSPDAIYIGGNYPFLWRGIHEVVEYCKSKSPITDIFSCGYYSSQCGNKLSLSGVDHILADYNESSSLFHVDIELFDKDNMPKRIFIGTSMDCDWDCSKCLVRMMGACSKIRATPNDILCKIEEYVSIGINSFSFASGNILKGYDKNLGVILDGIIKNGWDLNLWTYGGVSPELFNREIAYKMFRAGFESISIPVEFINDSIFNGTPGYEYRPGWEEAIGIASEFYPQNRIRASFLIGAPWQEMSALRRKFQEIHSAGAQPITIPFVVAPGTERYNENDLESLNPALWPCAHEGMRAEDLESLLCYSRDIKNVHLKRG
jgi:hypothetical protein